MNILFINSIRDWGGGEVWLMDTISGLRRRGHAVTLICRPDTPLAEKAAATQVDVVPIRFAGDFDPLVLWKVWKVMKKRRIEIVCTNTDKDLRVGGIAGKLARVPGIIPSREIDYPIKRTMMYRIAYGKLATRIIVNSYATQKTLLASAPYLRAIQTRIIYKGIDTRPYDKAPDKSLREEYGLKKEAPIVCFIGRLDERKGIRFLLQAWKEIHAFHSDAVLMIVGEGTMRNEIEHVVHRDGLSSSALLAGFREDVHTILLQSTMLVLPSLWEGFGYVLIEAMAARIPVVATRVSSIPEIVSDGESGMLIEPANARAIAGAVRYLLDHPKEASAMGQAGRGIVEKKFTLTRMIDDFEAMLKMEIENVRASNGIPLAERDTTRA